MPTRQYILVLTLFLSINLFSQGNLQDVVT